MVYSREFTNTIPFPESRYEPQPDYVRHQFLESQGYIQNAEGESSESFKREIKKDLEMHGGGQLAFKDQQAEVQHDNGRLHYLIAQICFTDKVSGKLFM